MNWQLNPQALSLGLSALVSGTIAVFAWRRRPATGATLLTLFMLAAAEWSLAYALELGSTSLAAKVFWAKVQYFGIVTVAPALLVLVVQYLGQDRWLTRRNIALLSIVPLLSLLLVWTNNIHGLIWSGIQLDPNASFPMLELEHGPAFWVVIAYSYACLLAGTLLLFRAFRRAPRLYRGQTGIILVGALAPWVANALYIFDLSPFPHLDLTPYAFVVSGLAAAWGLFRFQLFEIVPIARHTVLEHLSDGVIVLDRQGRIVDINPAAQSLIGRNATEAIGRPADQVLAAWPDLVRQYRTVVDTYASITIIDGQSQRFYDLRISPLRDQQGELAGRVIVLRNLTASKETEMALQAHQRKLEAQNVELHRLSEAVKQSANAVLITDLDGNIEYVNPSFEQATGYTFAEAVGQNPRILKSGKQSDDFYRELWETITAGKEWQGQFHNRRKDGILYWEQATISPIHDQHGQMTSFVAVKEDITARKQTEEALVRMLELSQVLATTRNLDIALSQAVNASVEIVPSADRGTLQWLDKDGEALQTVASTDSTSLLKEIFPFRPGVGIAGHALANKQTINVPDVQADGRFVPRDTGVYYRSLMVTPLLVKDQALGTLSLSSKHINAFSPKDETLISLVADQIAAALENARELGARQDAENALQLSSERLKILHGIDQSILAAQSPETIAVAVIRHIRRLIPCQRSVVMAVKDSGQTELLAAESDSELEPVTDLRIYEEICQDQALNRGWVHGAEDLTVLPYPSDVQQSLSAVGIRSYFVVPAFIQGKLVGTLSLESDQPRAFTSDHIAVATEVAASLAVAIRQTRLYEQAQQEIAERMQAEAKLRQYTAELEAQNAELDAFAHTVAHDLKNPLSSIRGYADVLAQSHATLPEEILQKFVNTIANNSRTMSTIIDELLLLSSVRAIDEIQTTPLEMEEIVAEAQGRLLHLIEEHQGEIVLPESWPVVLGYAPWIEAVWANYISNALKYGGQPPYVQIGADEAENGTIRFWVRDNGPGLTREEQARLFTPFERLHQVRAKGHGLGLSIVQRIVTKLGGQVGVESIGVPGQGSTFFFTLPALKGDED